MENKIMKKNKDFKLKKHALYTRTKQRKINENGPAPRDREVLNLHGRGAVLEHDSPEEEE